MLAMGWILKMCYFLVNNYGVAIILFTIISKLIILPFQMKSKKSMMEMARIQPKIKELEKQMKLAAKEFDFEKAAELRDIIIELRTNM